MPKPGGKLRQSRIAFVFGTRPEAIKLSPIVRALADLGEPPALYFTGQHPGLELANHRLQGFAATSLHCMGQPDPTLHADLVRSALNRLLPAARLQLLVVHGGTSSALGGALAAREIGIPLAHVEAGLRTFDPNLPWPEEENRVTIDRLADLLFAPTSLNAANLRRERVSGKIHVTGSSGIDALAELVGPLPARQRWRAPWRPFSLLVTCHRRENWDTGLDSMADAIRMLSKRMRVTLLLPPNPTVAEQMTRLLGSAAGVRLVPPLSHSAAVDAMRSADLILSDSGGIEEEAPALGVPLLVLREKTERPEGLTTGSTELVGTNSDRIIQAVDRLRRHRGLLRAMRRPCLPFGDGRASARIARHCLMFLQGIANRSPGQLRLID